MAQELSVFLHSWHANRLFHCAQVGSLGEMFSTKKKKKTIKISFFCYV